MLTALAHCDTCDVWLGADEACLHIPHDPRRDDPDRLGCAACGLPDCAHPDMIYAGVVPPAAEKPLFHSQGTRA